MSGVNLWFAEDRIYDVLRQISETIWEAEDMSTGKTVYVFREKSSDNFTVIEQDLAPMIILGDQA